MRDTEAGGTQRDMRIGVAEELAAAGLDDAQEIGRGGFGVVYRCVEEALDRLVAVKVLDATTGADERTRFLREQRALARFGGHPHIVQVLSADITVSGRPYLVMPFHRFGSLQARIRDRGPMPWQEVLSVGVKMAGALAAAHTHGIVHRDVNPANILLSDYGEPQLSDFGIARVAGAFETGTGMIAGTPAFTAPEVLRGAEPTVAADVYGLAATLFCLLTGHAAFQRRQGESMVAQFLRITSEPVPDLRRGGVPAPLCSALESAMAHNPEDRPADAHEFGDRLRNIQFSSRLAVDSMALPAEGALPATEAVAAAPDPVAAPRSVRTSPTPSTRYRPPSSPRAPIPRERLLGRLRAGRTRRLTLIHGPAGFGKSTLAGQVVDLLAADGVRTAWLGVDTDDDNVVWFLSHVIDAIRSVHPGVATDLERQLEQYGTDAARHVMTTLIDELHSSGESVALIIDDWHRVTSPATVAAMEFLLDHGCHHLIVVVTSRSRTGLPLGRLRVHDELVEIDESDLRFDEKETAAFLSNLGELCLSDAEVGRLRESTEGWAAALQLASLSLRGRDDPGAYIDQISGRHYAIGEYLIENVIDGLEPDLLDFVLRTSVPERVNADLAVALTGVGSGQDMLERVRQRDLFLRGIDDDLRWFRYDRLFADFLHDRLTRLQPGLLEELHRKAAEWFAAHDMLIEAVDHALAAGAPEFAVAVVADHAELLMEQSRMATFLGLVAKLPSALITADPRLQLHIAWANIAVQRAPAALAALDRVDMALAAEPGAEDRSAEVAFEVRLAHAATELITDRPVTVPEELLAQVRDSVRPFLAHALAVVAMVSALYRFDYPDVRRWYRWIEPIRDRARGPFGPVYCDCIAGSAAYEQLDIAAAETAYRTALRFALSSGAESYVTRLASALLGELLYEKGQFVEARELLSAGSTLEAGAIEFLTASCGTGARLAAVRGDLDAVCERLDQGAELATNLALDRLAARVLNERVRLGLPISDEDRDRLQRLAPYVPQPDARAAITAELSHDSAIRLLLAEGTDAAAEQACRRAEQMVNGIRAQDRPHALLNAELLYGCCLAAAGRSAQAAQQLAPALTRAAELGLVRLVVDAGPQLRPVIETLTGATVSTPESVRLFLRQVLAEFERTVPSG
ncbi:protein kinase [Nocardia sp. NPDC005825]|uniref:protein kinase domain-containing protein n=1 Tax=unclassified Nocardia TaxID=2637762 RepID=UPI0033E7F4CC